MLRNLKADILIIGAGPAGLTAAIYAARAGKATIVLEGRAASRLSFGYEIENYPGFPSINSLDLLGKFIAHARQFGATGKPFSRDRMIPGEDRLTGMGVSYCATCDGPLYRGADVAAYGHSDAAVEDVLALNQSGGRVHWIPGKKGEEAAKARSDEFVRKGIHIHPGVEIAEIAGEKRVEKIVLAGEGTRDELTVAGVFIFREIPTAPFFGRAGISLDHKQCIAVDRAQKTNLPGVFAAGDVTCGGLQIASAVGEGCVAAMQALAFLRTGDK